MTPHATSWPAPGYRGVLGHVPRWGSDALGLLTEGAELAPVFSLQLWRKAVVGYRPDWNRMVLGDMDGFRSRRSLSQLSPYLAGGVVALDAPGHRARRAALNPAFHRKVVTGRFADRLDALAVAQLPTGDFDAVGWASTLIRSMIKMVFLGQRFPAGVLSSFLAPLDRGLPGPLLPRPVRIARMERELTSNFADPDPTTLAPLFGSLAGGVEEARVAIAAAYDTTAHTLAFALWELAAHPEFNVPEGTDAVVKETLRLYPAGWVGSRVSVRHTEIDGRLIPAGRLVMYSPYLTHRDPELWSRPSDFAPDRFAEPLPAWGYLPFSAGERTCLGAALATLMLRAAVQAFNGSELSRISSRMRPRGVVTLTPEGPILLRRQAPGATTAQVTATKEGRCGN